ncbi:MAG TPA: hypothetical protein VHX60_10115 [Acidobacteriaceae bacterium]|jgi:hypothetical protein|nr:hypothetical protein [Acidobacteriaceae bacterium]
MRLTPRLALRFILLIVAVAILSLRLAPRFLPHRTAAPHAGDLAVTSPLNQPGGEPAPAAAYAIYSDLYQKPAPGTAPEPLVFAGSSQTDIPQVGPSCLKPSTPDEHELADAFTAANTQSHAWQPKFTIPLGYRVLAPGELAEARACLSPQNRSAAQCAPYSSMKHIRYLGVPGLDPAQTHALVSVIKSCGMQCGTGGIFEVEKSGSAWQRVPATDFTRDCSWMY